jgi:hypothetical protein
MSLTSLSDIKQYLQITSSDQDNLITLYRDLVEAEVEAYCNSNLIEGTYTDVLNYEQSKVDSSGYRPFNTRQDLRKLFLRNGYVTTFTLVSDTTTVTSDNYDINEDAGVVTLYNYYDDSQEKLKGIYTSGFTTATCPTDLKMVIFQGVKSVYENNTQASQGKGNVKSKQIKDFSVSYGNEQTGMISTIDNTLVKNYLVSNNKILSKYKRIYA